MPHLDTWCSQRRSDRSDVPHVNKRTIKVQRTSNWNTGASSDNKTEKDEKIKVKYSKKVEIESNQVSRLQQTQFS